MKKKIGKVYLVGSGPGDPELLTLKARRIMAMGDVILYDALIDPAILNWALPRAKKIHSGKRGQDRHSVPQEKINAAMVKFAKQGKTVVRLKGGDPFLFGRGGEEAEFLADKNVPFEVVAGVSSITAVPVCAGIPLTDRRVTAQLTVISGHLTSGKTAIDWKKISPKGTLVIAMGVSSLQKIIEKLLRLGWKKSVPVAGICSGSTVQQQVVEGTLLSFLERARSGEKFISSPALIVIGEVVRLRQRFF